jgi:hypothetical protein
MFVRVDFVGYLQVALREKWDHCVGVFMISGSSSPARSLRSTTSEYVAPIATILDSSAERAIQRSNGAERSNSSRRLFSEEITVNLNSYLGRIISVVAETSRALLHRRFRLQSICSLCFAGKNSRASLKRPSASGGLVHLSQQMLSHRCRRDEVGPAAPKG